MYILLTENFGSKTSQYRIETIIDEDNVILFYYERPPGSSFAPQQVQKVITRIATEGVVTALYSALKAMEEYTGIDLIHDKNLQRWN